MSANLLGEASDVLDDAVDLEVALEAVAGLTVPALADFCAIDVLSLDDAFTRVAVPRHPDARWARSVETWFPSDPEGDHPIADVLKGGHPELVSDVRTAPGPIARRVDARAPAPTSYLVVPLAARGQRLGVLSLVSWTPTHRYRLEDLLLACRLARQLALAVDNRQLGEEIWEFLSVLSHELRTPLAAMHGWVSLLRRHDLSDAQVSRGLEVLERNARLQARLLDEVLEWIRLRSGATALERRPVDMAAVVREALALVAPEAAAKNVQLRMEGDPGGGRVAGDPVRLRQAVASVASVALANTGVGGSLVVVLTWPAASSVSLAVRTEGAGDRPPPLLGAAAHGARARARRGLGLGVLLARRLVEMHGGTFEIGRDESEIGLTARIALPALEHADRNDLQAPCRGDSTGEGGSALEGRRVLVIEDDADIREFLRLSLERRGARVRIAGSGAAALWLLDRETVDVVLSDLTLPEGDGYSVMRAIRARGLTRLPAIALSALSGPAERANSAAAGFAEHLTKPVDPEHLARSLARVIREAAME